MKPTRNTREMRVQKQTHLEYAQEHPGIPVKGGFKSKPIRKTPRNTQEYPGKEGSKANPSGKRLEGGIVRDTTAQAQLGPRLWTMGSLTHGFPLWVPFK